MSTNSAGTQNINLAALDDDIALEHDMFLLQFVHNTGQEFVDVVEIRGEFVRHRATVEIIDTDRKYNLPLIICSRRH